MFEPEVWKMVRTLERERVDQGVNWRMRLAEERRTARRPTRFGPARGRNAGLGERGASRVGRALLGRGG
ncbi:MAG TPA: hypothetical protein VFD32_20600 [Dehalococcoidia bacterium]|nr:hypothetical protein [Dehalococcoidia bacterium]